MAHYLCPNLDQLFPQRRQCPVPHCSGQHRLTKEVSHVVCQDEQLQPHLIVHKVMTRQPCPLERVLAFLDPLLCRAPKVVEAYDTFRGPTQVGYDEPHPRKQFTLMPFHLGHYAAGATPTICPIEKISVPDHRRI